jgi:serine/threonine protein kinase/uncharacterized protein YecT (DUF1311 family)
MPVEHVHGLAKGTRLNQYELVSILGAGGFGITYMARDTSLDTLVAIKEYLPGDLAVRQDDSRVTAKSTTSRGDFDWGLDRFLSEAKTLARFRHPNIVRVNQIFQANNTAYLVMEYAKGQSLEEILKEGPLTEEQTKDILTPIMDGLQRVHEQGFLHRDIKPANIILRDDGGALLIDFGAARQAMETRTRALTSIVTEGYAPLEQYHGTGHQGPWTDIYALGAVAYKCLTGTKPPSAAARVRNDPLVPLAVAAKSKVSFTFAAAVGAALNLDENMRPQSITEFTGMIAGTIPAPQAAHADDATRMMGAEAATQLRRPATAGSSTRSASGRPSTNQGPPPGMPARAGAAQTASTDVHGQASRRNMTVYLGVAAVALLAVAGAWYMQNAPVPDGVATKTAAPAPVTTSQGTTTPPVMPPPSPPSTQPPDAPSAIASAVPPPAQAPTATTPATVPPPQAPSATASAVPPPPQAPSPTAPAAAPPPAVMTGPPPPATKQASAPRPATLRTSFNCGAAKSNAERIVCSDNQLATLDVKVAELYQLGLRSVADTNAFRGEQQAWLEQRNECSNRACLTESYGERIKELERWVGP